MWNGIAEHLPSVSTVMIALLAVAVIAAIYRLNHLLHEWGDPPWKKEKKQHPKK